MPERFEDIFAALMKLAAHRHLNLVIDEFQEFFNLIPHCMCLGQAAGIAAALAVRLGTDLRQVPYAELKKELLRGGAILP